MRAMPCFVLLLAAMLFAADPNEFTVLDWNIDRGTELDAIAAQIEAQHPDIATLQEVDLNTKRTGRKDIAKELGQKLGMPYAFGQAFEEVNQGTKENPAYQGQATFSKFQIVSKRVLTFAHQTGFWKPEPYLPSWTPQRRNGGRVALITELSANGHRLIVYNLHLESRGAGNMRLEQLGEAIKDAKTYPPDVPVILTGDLNTKYKTTGAVSMLEAQGFQNCFGKARPKTHHIAFTLDWIFVRGPLVCEEGRVVTDAKASDHYPVVARVRFK